MKSLSPTKRPPSGREIFLAGRGRCGAASDHQLRLGALEVARLLSFLPQNNMEDPPVIESGDDPQREAPELADLVPPSTGRAWKASDGSSLLQLQLGRISVRNSISEETRTLTIEHVIPPDDLEDLEDVG